MKSGQMVKYFLRTLSIILLVATNSFAQKFGFERVLKDQPLEPTVFCVPNNPGNKEALERSGIEIRFSTRNWMFITSTPKWISESKASGLISNFYFEYAPPSVLADTARIWHNVNPVHNGDAPLPSSYTGKDVIIGIVDQGLDWTHPDFQDANGKTRVLRYWDHSYNGPNPALPYGYGQVWDSTSINNGTCTSTEASTAHGTTVAGMAVGNGLANGTQKGMAPDANIIIVETNFNLPNWTLTIADAVEYIFKVADTLNMPAVVNLSLGSYFGSHDATDPAGERINDLLDEKPGRIVVCAAGNSGDKGKYHLHNDVSSDTSFVWFLNNPSGVLGSNTIFFDLWSDQSEATWDYAFGADTPSPGFVFRGRTDFIAAQTNLGGVIFDTLWNNGNRIATFEIYPEIVGANYHMQILAKIDSTSYLYRFETRGSGSYDLWSGSWLGYNNMVTAIPSPIDVPEIVNYAMPDTLQTIVSSWNCSDKVISVGVFRNKSAHWDNNGNLYVNNSVTPGALNPGSSKGPTRNGIIKPDVAAAGDVTLTAAPLWILTNPAYNALIDSGGWHGRNGGTSMASPIVAGIAGLYLERCSFANYANFRTDLHATAYTDVFTGTSLPNNAFGYGKPDAFALLQEQTLNANVPVISISGSDLLSTPDYGYQWIVDDQFIPGATNQTYNYTGNPSNGDFQVLTYNSDGCTAISLPLSVGLGLNEAEHSNYVLYPNPTSSNFEVSTDESFKIESIIDRFGRPVSFMQTSSHSFQLDNHSVGVYIVTIRENNGNLRNVKLIITN